MNRCVAQFISHLNMQHIKRYVALLYFDNGILFITKVENKNTSPLMKIKINTAMYLIVNIWSGYVSSKCTVHIKALRVINGHSTIFTILL